MLAFKFIVTTNVPLKDVLAKIKWQDHLFITKTLQKFYGSILKEIHTEKIDDSSAKIYGYSIIPQEEIFSDLGVIRSLEILNSYGVVISF